ALPAAGRQNRRAWNSARRLLLSDELRGRAGGGLDSDLDAGVVGCLHSCALRGLTGCDGDIGEVPLHGLPRAAVGPRGTRSEGSEAAITVRRERVGDLDGG